MKKIFFSLSLLCIMAGFTQLQKIIHSPQQIHIPQTGFTYLAQDTNPSDAQEAQALHLISRKSNPRKTNATHGKRYQVSGDQSPYSAVVHIVGKDHMNCSGALVGPYTVLTAAHCVYVDVDHNRQKGGKLRNPLNLTVYAGGDRSSITASVVRIYAAPGTNQLDWGLQFSQIDYALLVLNKDIGNKAGFFNVKEVKFKKGQEVKTIGFPYDTNSWNPTVSEGTVKEVHTGYIYYNVNSKEGDSGSPVFLQGDLNNIVAVHAFDVDNGALSGATTPTHSALFSFVNKYRNETPSPKDQFTSIIPGQQTGPRMSSIGKLLRDKFLKQGNDWGGFRNPGMENPFNPKPGNSQKPSLGNLPKPKAGNPTKPNFNGLPKPQIGK